MSERATAQERVRWNEPDRQFDAAVQQEQDLRAAANATPATDAAAKAAARLRAEAAGLAMAQAHATRSAIIEALQMRVFNSLPYAKRMTRCERPEYIDGPTESAWADINAYLDISATCVATLDKAPGACSSR